MKTPCKSKDPRPFIQKNNYKKNWHFLTFILQILHDI